MGLSKGSKTFANLAPAKQTKIIEAAVTEFSAKGYRGTSINALVARLGIAKGSLFQYFGSKKSLFLFIFDQVIEQAKEHLRPVRDENDSSDFFGRLEKTLLAGVTFIRQHPRYYKLYLTVMFESNVPFRTEILQSFRHYSLEYLHSLLETARARGEIREDVPLEQVAFWLDAMMDRFLQAQVTHYLDGGSGLHEADDVKIHQWIDSLMKVVRDGLKPKGALEGYNESDPILVVAACRFELDPLLEQVAGKKMWCVGGREGWQGYLEGNKVCLLVSGAGNINAAQAMTAALEKGVKPKMVIQMGCGGGFAAAGVQVGDVCLASCEYDVHLGLEAAKNAAVQPLPFKVLPQSIEPNRFEVDPDGLAVALKLKPNFKLENMGFHHGPFISVSTITTTNETAANYYRHYRAVIENMEGAATAQVCHLYHIPFMEIRGVSNLVGNRGRETWELDLAANHAAMAVSRVIKNVAPQATQNANRS